MTLLVLTDVHKHFASRTILDGASLQVDPGEKLGLVGPNGAGKTTLLRLLTGEDEIDTGQLALRRGTRIATVPQRPVFVEGETVRQHAEGGLSELRAAMVAHHEACDALARLHEGASPDAAEESRLLHEQDRLAHEIDALGGWHTEHRVEQVLAGVGLREELWEREARTLSGGEKSRTALARALIGGHDLLLLDEPTNHLDIAGIEWLENELHALGGAVLVVSHDRRLLDNAVDGIVELEGGKLKRYPGGYTRYVALREERYVAELRAWQEQQDYIRKEDAFIRRYLAGQRAAEAQGRRTRLERMERLPQPKHDVRAPVLTMPEVTLGSDIVVEVDDVSGGYGRPLFSGVSFRVGRTERIGIVGRNGTGKTTLLRILAGRAEPLAGKVRSGARNLCGYYDQESGGLSEDGTVMSELRRDFPRMTDGEARDWLARFLFRGDDVDKPVTALSGGERARLCLARLIRTGPAWLALDEPTNHLDLAGTTALEEALAQFGGAIVLVSHDRQLLDDLCTRIVEVGVDGPGTARGVRDFPGNFSAWRARRMEEAAESAAPRAARPAARNAPAAASSTRAGPALAARRAKNPWKLKEVEARIMRLEAEQRALHEECARPGAAADGVRLRKAGDRLAALDEELAAAYAEWESHA
ncbi:MAG TPA: ABC-F family ATP-binding cassette domain-containing protein [Planctomycetota bacterium]|nr:ABC-F family ATP-binding cassette domain-containing protein [Planctomycetota bacterium]